MRSKYIVREANFDEGLDTIMDVKGRCVTLADRNPGIGIETFSILSAQVQLSLF